MANSNDLSQDDQVCLVNQERLHYPLKIVPILYLQLLLMMTLVTGGFLLPVFYNNEQALTTDTFSSVNYLNICIWAVVTLATWYVKAEQKVSRVLGYHEFYDATRYLHRVAFYTMCGGNVLLLVISCITHNYCFGGGVTPCTEDISLSPVNYQQIIFVLEIIICVPLLIKHIIEVMRFNNREAPPDVLKDDMVYRMNYGEVIVGVRGPSNLERLLERQADQLITLNQRNHILCQQIYALTQQLQRAQLTSASL